MYRLSDYQYHLPEKLIAQTPVAPADHSKLLVTDGVYFHDHHFYDLLKLLTPKDVLFFNNTKVIKARIPLKDIFVEIPHHNIASRVVEEGEIFFLQMIDEYRFEWLISLTKRVRKWSVLHFREDITLTVEEFTQQWIIFHLQGAYVLFFFEMYGQMPLPPYISHSAEKEEHYQTRFAQHIWSVAAPTASLHFTDDLLQSLETVWIRSHYLTLHVGLGTFKPVDTEDIREYHIHEETIIIDESIFESVAREKEEWNSIVGVWTTVARTLETLPYLWKLLGKSHTYWDSISANITEDQCQKYIHSWQQKWSKIICQTKIFIYPGFERKIVDGLITNFHVSWSTLLMLVASFVWYDEIMRMYRYAIEHEYRFFSFGDAMLLRKRVLH